MKKIILISCASKKINKKIKAQDLYISALFQKNLRERKGSDTVLKVNPNSP